MKPIFRFLLLAVGIMLASTFPALAQEGLRINEVFDGRYINSPSVTATLMSGDQKYLRKYQLTRFATFRADTSFVRILQPLVLADGAKATGRSVNYSNGRLVYAYFILPPKKVDKVMLNRYLYYVVNTRSSSVTLIYFEGKLSARGAEEVIRSMAKQRIK